MHCMVPLCFRQPEQSAGRGSSPLDALCTLGIARVRFCKMSSHANEGLSEQFSERYVVYATCARNWNVCGSHRLAQRGTPLDTKRPSTCEPATLRGVSPGGTSSPLRFVSGLTHTHSCPSFDFKSLKIACKLCCSSIRDNHSLHSASEIPRDCNVC